MNQQVKKGGKVLAAVFVLFIIGAVKLFFLVVNAAKGTDLSQPEEILRRVQSQSFVFFWILLAVFGCVWLYSVIDAFQEGKALDRAEEGGRP